MELQKLNESELNLLELNVITVGFMNKFFTKIKYRTKIVDKCFIDEYWTLEIGIGSYN